MAFGTWLDFLMQPDLLIEFIGQQSGAASFGEISSAISHLENLAGPVRLNGAFLDLRHSDLEPGKWKAVGISLNIVTDREIWFGYSHPSALGVSSGLRSAGFVTPPGLLLKSGDQLRLANVEISELADQTLAVVDRQRATGDICVVRVNGTIERPQPPITLAHPLLMNPGDGTDLVLPTLESMFARLATLQNIAATRRGEKGQAILTLVGNAQRHFDELQVCRNDLRAAEDQLVGNAWVWSLLCTSQAIAAAFGFAVAIAEEEAGSRQIARGAIEDRGRGGLERGRRLKAYADAWKAKALALAIPLDRAHPDWKRSRLATEIALAFDEDPPGQKALDDWLRDEAEPSGQIKSRARKTRGARKKFVD